MQARHRAEGAFGLDDPSELASWFAATELMGTSSSYQDRLNEADRVTLEGMNLLIRNTLQPSTALVTLVGPVDTDITDMVEAALDKAPGSTLYLNEPLEEEEAELSIVA